MPYEFPFALGSFILLPRLRRPNGTSMSAVGVGRAHEIAASVEAFVRDVVIAYEKDTRIGAAGPSDDLVAELRDKARAVGVLTPHILPDGSHLSQRETAIVLEKTGLSPLGPLACNKIGRA